jgi:hypothetical protein
MKKIAKLLKADFNESSDLASIAAMLAGKGRGNDTLLAHITPREAEILKAAGGSGTTNPETGLLEFYDGFDTSGFEGITSDQVAASAPAPTTTPVSPSAFDTAGFEGITPTQVAQETPPTGGYTGGGIKAQPGLPDIPAEGLPGVRSLAYQGGPIYTPPPTAPAVTTPSGEIDIGFGAGKYAPTPPEKSGFLDKLTTEQMARLGLAGGLGLYGATQAKRGAQQAQQAAAEQKAVGAPYQAKGQELIRAAETGELTPTSQQQLQVLQARLAQGAESRGGVGAAQVAAQTEAYRQQLLAQQYNLGLQVSNIGDQIALGAIKTGLAADQALNQASTNFYTNLAAIGAGIPLVRTP